MRNEELNDLHSSTGIIRVIKKVQMGGACGIHGREAKRLRCFGGETLKQIGCWKERGVDAIILQVSKSLYGVTLLTTSLLLLSVLSLSAFKAP